MLQSLYDLIMETFGHADLIAHAQDAMNAAGGEEYANFDSFSGANDFMVGLVSGTISELNDLINSGLLQTSKDLDTALNRLHAAKQMLEELQTYHANLQSAQEMGDFNGGMALLGNTAGSAGNLIGAASAGLGLVAVVAAPEAAVVIALASAGLGTLSTVLKGIQSAVGDFSVLVAALQKASEAANESGEPYVFTPSGGGNGGGGGGGSGGSTPSGVSPIVIEPGSGPFGQVRIDPAQQQVIRDSDLTPPPPAPPPPGGPSGGPGGGPITDPSWGGGRRPDLEEIFKPPPGGPGGGRGGPSPGGPGTPPGNDPVRRDPLVLDLDGNGVQLTDLGRPPVFFDANGDGVATLTGWVHPGDGLLARDIDGKGLIETQAELFGTNTIDAITDLASHDANGDGRIDASDPIWSILRVWRDLNQDGISQPDELQTMEEAGILQINLDQQLLGRQVGDNLIHSSTTFELATGELREAQAVFFGLGTLFNQTAPPQVFEAGDPILRLPDVKGYGTLPDLRVAAFLDPELRGMVEALARDIHTLDGRSFHLAFEAMALHWAGVTDVEPGPGSPSLPNMQHEAFLEAFRGAERPELASSNARVAAEDAYQGALAALKTRFALGVLDAGPGAGATPQDIAAFIASPILALASLDVTPNAGILTGNLDRVLYEIAVNLTADPEAAMARLDQVMSFLVTFREEYFAEHGPRQDTTFRNEDFDAFVRDTLAPLIPNAMVAAYAFTALNTRDWWTGAEGDAVSIEIPRGLVAFFRSKQIPLGASDNQTLTIAPDGTLNADWEPDLAFLYRDGDGSRTVDLTNRPMASQLFLPDIEAAQVAVAVVGEAETRVTFYNGDVLTFLGLPGPVTDNRPLTIWTADGEQLQDDRRMFLGADVDGEFTGSNFVADIYVYNTGDGNVIVTEPWTNNDTTRDRVILADATPDQVTLTAEDGDLVITFAHGGPGDSLRIIDQFSVFGILASTPQFKIDEFAFADGTLLTAQEMTDFYFARLATAGDDTITGFRFGQTMLLSDGDDVLIGGRGANTYVRGPEVTGTTRIEDGGTLAGGRLVIRGFELADAGFARDEDDVVITLPNGTVTLATQMGRNGLAALGAVEFDDIALTATDIAAQIFPLDGAFVDVPGTGEPSVLSGEGVNARFDGGDGDTLEGGAGSDIYLIRSGVGDLTIRETGFARGGRLDVDRAVFTDLDPADVRLVREASNDLTVQVLGTDQTILIVRHFDNETRGLEFFHFADGTVWNRAQIALNSVMMGTEGNDTIVGTNGPDVILGSPGDDSLRGGAGDDIYILRPGHGSDIIQDSRGNGPIGNTLRLPETSREDLRIELVVEPGGVMSDLLLRYTAEDSVLLRMNNSDDAFPGIRAIQRVELGDGTVLTDEDLKAQAAIYGTDGADVITGRIRIDGLGGDDALISTFPGTEFLWRVGNGNDRILNENLDGGRGTLILQGVALEDVTLSRDGEDLRVAHATSGEVVAVVNHFALRSGVTEMVFADATLDRPAMATLSLTPATDGADTIIGGRDDELFRGGPGDDLLIGGGGSDTYLWQMGDGNDTIDQTVGTGDVNVLVLEDVDGPDAVQLWRPGGRDLGIRVLETGESITLVDQFSGIVRGLQRIDFADGSSLSLDGIEAEVPLVDDGGTGRLAAAPEGSTLQSSPGAQILNGGRGSDTYLWQPGSGNDTIAELDFEGAPIASPDDVLRLIGVRSDAVALSRIPGTDDLAIRHLPTDETITVLNQFLAPLAGIERLVFDNASWSRAEIYHAAGGDTFTGDGSDRVLTGGPGPDVFALSSGNETVVTGGGRDTIILGPDAGQNVLEGFQRGIEGTRIELTHAPFADFDALLAATADTPEGAAIDLGDGVRILLARTLKMDLGPDNFGFARPPLRGTEGDDDILGTRFDDHIILVGGNNLVQPGLRNDTVEGGDGFDVAFFAGRSTDFRIEGDHREAWVTDLNPDDGDEGANLLHGIDLLSFLGDRVTVPLNRPETPLGEVVVTGPDGAPLAGVAVALQPDGDAPPLALGSTDAAGVLMLDLPPAEGLLTAALVWDPATGPGVTTSDALDVLRLAVGLSPGFGPADPRSYIAADMNGDGRIDTSDALEVLRHAVGGDSAHAPRWIFYDAATDWEALDLGPQATRPDPGIRLDPDAAGEGLAFAGVLIGNIQEHV